MSTDWHSANPCRIGVLRLVTQLEEAGVAKLGVAFSGGADSTALLLAAVHSFPGRVHALHINHGLQVAAADFERHCEDFCAKLGVALTVARLHLRPQIGDSTESVARAARYQSLAMLSSKLAIKNIALAQHADDQVESVMLALSRGAGLPGLSGMAEAFTRHGARFHRPILNQSGVALRQWLTAGGVEYIEDPTNVNTALTRNRIRHEVIPNLARAFPAWRETFARSARHAAQAQALLNDLAGVDAENVGLPPRIAALQTLSPARQANILRHWLRSDHCVAPREAQLTELLKQVAACQTRGHRLNLKIADGYIVRNADALQYLPADASV